MADYIDRDIVIRYLRNKYHSIGFKEPSMTINKFVETLSKMPTADVAVLIRCKDCRRWFASGGDDCPFGGYPGPSDFCSYATRRD